MPPVRPTPTTAYGDIFIPVWPGPRHLLPAYDAGWRAFAIHAEAGNTTPADPADHAPPLRADAELNAWCLGWTEHQLVAGVVASAECTGFDPRRLNGIALAVAVACRSLYGGGAK